MGNPKLKLGKSLCVQVGRVILHFCDRKSLVKHTLLSFDENIDALAGIFSPESSKGVIRTIIDILGDESINRNIADWFSAVVESFLRGADHRYHRWIAKTGIIDILVKNLSEKTFQAQYDLLAEIIKWDVECMTCFEQSLAKSDHSEAFFCLFSLLFRLYIFPEDPSPGAFGRARHPDSDRVRSIGFRLWCGWSKWPMSVRSLGSLGCPTWPIRDDRLVRTIPNTDRESRLR